MSKTVTIELTEQEAEIFVYYFRKHQDFWQMVRNKSKPGKVILHFDSAGEIRKKELHIISRDLTN